MPAIIESVGTACSRRKVLPKGARRLADDAIATCLRRAHLKPSDLDLLVNAGVYRENNLAEPALASMIQEDIGANPGHPPTEHSHGTFSFDVANGGCGVITGLEIVDGFVRSSTVGLGVVVASDSAPDHEIALPFPNVGGAVLLRPGAPDVGFQDFEFENFPEFAECFESAVAWHAKEHHFPLAPIGENVLELEVRPDFPVRAAECAESTVRRFLAKNQLAAADVDLLVASTYPETFALELAHRLKLSLAHVAIPEERARGAHTAGLIASLESAAASGRLATARNALFVAVGAGITVAAALYRHGAATPLPGSTP